MSTISKILIIIQRSNGDVLLSYPLIERLYYFFDHPKIDILVNSDTLAVANSLSYVHEKIIFSYKDKKEKRYDQEKKILRKIYKKYDLSISLTSSDRSVLYAILASSNSIAPLDVDFHKSWWKKIFLKHNYSWNSNCHILLNNLKPLTILGIPHENILTPVKIQPKSIQKIKNNLQKLNVKKFIIFHPSAQYTYKVYPKELRNKLLEFLTQYDFHIVVTGGLSKIDKSISKELPKSEKIINLIGKTSIDEIIALSSLSICYIGMDTLNMHISASQNKRIFAIMGPTLLKVWSPWSNKKKVCSNHNNERDYGNISIFQSDLKCVPCGFAGCNNIGRESKCLEDIDPKKIGDKFNSWYRKQIDYSNN